MGSLDEKYLEAALDDARARWPGVVVAPDVFFEALRAAVAEREAEALGDGGASDDTAFTAAEKDLTLPCSADVYLVLACLARQPEAIAAFERVVMVSIRASIERAATEHADADDALQTTREKLLVGAAPEGPKLAQYAGRGPLASWVRVVAMRELLMVQRKARRHATHRANDDTAVVTTGATAASVEMAMLRGVHGEAFRDAVQHAMRTLSVEQRTVLRFHLRDGLGIDAIAPMLGVHRATAARKLARAREDVLTATRAILNERHGLTTSEARSLCLALVNEIDVSVARFLDDEVGA